MSERIRNWGLVNAVKHKTVSSNIKDYAETGPSGSVFAF